tara:strand:- start:231 stop:359 length:129 start_codon:yes stop_codon:yes gene_type:complete
MVEMVVVCLIMYLVVVVELVQQVELVQVLPLQVMVVTELRLQ